MQYSALAVCDESTYHMKQHKGNLYDDVRVVCSIAKVYGWSDSWMVGGRKSDGRKLEVGMVGCRPFSRQLPTFSNHVRNFSARIPISWESEFLSDFRPSFEKGGTRGR